MHILSQGHRRLIHLLRQYSFVEEEWGLPSLSSQSLGFPSKFLFTFHIHTCLIDIIYTISLMLLTKRVVQMRHFQNVQWSFPRNPFQDKGRPSHEVWLLQAITHDIPVVCTPGTFIKQTNSPPLSDNTIQIDCSIAKQ